MIEETKKSRAVKYPLPTMQVGDTFDVKCFKKDSKKIANRLRSASQMYKKNKQLDTSYKVTEVIGAVILERTK